MSMPDRMPLAALTYNRQTGCYGFRVWFDGRPPHYVMEVFGSRERAQDWLDPHREYVWEEEPSQDGLVLAVARRFREESVAERMLKWSERRDRTGLRKR
jgi:hypothetical protein